MDSEYKVKFNTSADTEATKQITHVAQVNPRSISDLTTGLLVFALILSAAVLVCDLHAMGSRQDEDNIGEKGRYNPDIKTSVEWKNQVNHYHSQGGLELDNNEIVIPRNGLYFVYCQASFRVRCDSSDSDNITSHPWIHLSHTVKRWSSSYGDENAKKIYQTLLHSARTACQKTACSDQAEEGSWFSAVYMGAVFNLMKGDRLKTMAEEKMLANLEEEEGKTYFGLFSL